MSDLITEETQRYIARLPAAVYAGKLYPRELINIYDFVLGRDVLRVPFIYSEQPELEIDRRLIRWLKMIPNIDAYIQQIREAVDARGCIDMVIDRINLELLLETDKGDTITIYSGRKKKLIGEASKEPDETEIRSCQEPSCRGFHKAVASDDNFCSKCGGKIIDPLAPIERPQKDGQPYDVEDPDSMYEHKETIVTRAPRKSWDDAVKAVINAKLTEAGYILQADRNAVFTKLEKSLRRYDSEQNLLARIAYLIIFEAFQNMPVQARLAAIPRLLLTVAPDATATTKVS